MSAPCVICGSQADEVRNYCWQHRTVKAVDATKDSFDGARVGVVELFGGKDAKGK